MPSTKQPVKVAQLVGIRGTIMKYSVYTGAFSEITTPQDGFEGAKGGRASTDESPHREGTTADPGGFF